MRRTVSTLAILFCLAVAARAQITVEGETRLVVSKLPFTLKAPAGADIYLWRLPDGWAGTDKDQSFVVEKAPAGVGSVSVLSISIDYANKKTTKTTHTLKVELQTGPAPPDPKPPDPPPDPQPKPVAGLRVLIVEESGERSKLPASQQAVIFSKAVRDWLNANCAEDKNFNSGRAWTIQDKDVDLSAFGKTWTDLMARPRTALPWVIVWGNDRVLHEGALPKDVAGTLDLLKKYAPQGKKGGKR